MKLSVTQQRGTDQRQNLAAQQRIHPHMYLLYHILVISVPHQHYLHSETKRGVQKSYLISGVVISAASESEPSLLVNGNKPETETQRCK